MHNIDVTLQLVSAQKDANASEQSVTWESELPPWLAFNSVLQGPQIEFTIDHIL